MIKKFNYEKYYPKLALFVMVVLGGFLIYSLLMFLNPILGATIMYILCRPMQIWFTEKKKWNNSLATITSMTVSFLILIVPIVGISYMMIGKITEILSHPEALFSIFDKIHHYVNDKVKFEVLSPDTVVSIKGTITVMASSMLDQTFTILSDLAMMYFILYFMLASRKRMEATVQFYLPYKPENIQVFKNELKAQTYSNAIVTPALALIQGITASIGYWLLGVEEPLFWGMMTGVFSFMPLVGCMFIWVPLSIFMLANGDTWHGIGVIIYSILITSNIDNVCRLIFQKKFADVHPLITLMGFLMGIKYFGISGIIIGPVLMSFFLIMIKNFRKEFMDAPEEDLPTTKNHA